MSDRPHDRIVQLCARCGKDWTRDLLHIADLLGATLDAVCECGSVVAAEGAERGVHLIEGLVSDVMPGTHPR